MCLMLIWKVPLRAPPNLVVKVLAESSTAFTFMYLTYVGSVVLVALTVKSSLFKVNGKFESRVNTTSVFRTGEAAVGDMLTADMTEFLVTRLLEWLMVAPLMTTVGLRVVERSAWLKASVRQTS